MGQNLYFTWERTVFLNRHGPYVAIKSDLDRHDSVTCDSQRLILDRSWPNIQCDLSKPSWGLKRQPPSNICMSGRLLYFRRLLPLMPQFGIPLLKVGSKIVLSWNVSPQMTSPNYLLLNVNAEIGQDGMVLANQECACLSKLLRVMFRHNHALAWVWSSWAFRIQKKS